jgi:hypothetical protein
MPGRHFEFADALAFERPLPVKNRFQRVLHDSDIGQCFEKKKTGFAEVIAVGFRSAELHDGCDGRMPSGLP